MGRYLGVAFLALVLVGNFNRVGDEEWRNKIDEEVWESISQNREMDFMIVFESQASLSRLSQFKTKEEKGKYVFERLRDHARQSQQQVIRLLEDRKYPYRSFFLANVIASRGGLDFIVELAKRSEVSKIAPDPWAPLDQPERLQNSVTLRQNIEWGIRKIGADQVWEMGFDGTGVRIGGADTGFSWEHPAIREKYQGWDGEHIDHNYSWHDAIRAIDTIHRDSIIVPELNPCGLDSKFPCDDNGHGTHTMGTMVGDDGQGNQIGVAPGAKWVACRNMERGYGKPSTYIECFEWFLAPTDVNNENPDPTRSPHVINNSWGCPPKEGCNATNWEVMERVVDNLKAAGIFVVSSAGNSGSGCGSVDDPPAMFENAFSVGASRINDTIAGFSSRGPVLVDGSGRLKPNVVAPGAGVRSAVLPAGYQSWSGTSMAGPHVAGAVALIISANPEMAGQIDAIEDILERTAKPVGTLQNCGGIAGSMVPNNTYGFGRINVLEAVQVAIGVSSEEVVDAAQVDVRVFPNPSIGSFYIDIEGLDGAIKFNLYDQVGQLVQRYEWYVHDGFRSRIDTPLPPGIYFFQVIQENLTWEGKIISQ